MGGKYAITMLTVALTTFRAITKQMLKCTPFCISAAFSILLKYNNVLVEFNTKEITNILLWNKLNIELNIKGTTKKKLLTF